MQPPEARDTGSGGAQAHSCMDQDLQQSYMSLPGKSWTDHCVSMQEVRRHSSQVGLQSAPLGSFRPSCRNIVRQQM